MIPVILSCIISAFICDLAFADANLEQKPANQLVSPDIFGELVDMVTPGYLHWNQESGDVVDPDSDRNDIDNPSCDL